MDRVACDKCRKELNATYVKICWSTRDSSAVSTITSTLCISCHSDELIAFLKECPLEGSKFLMRLSSMASVRRSSL